MLLPALNRAKAQSQSAKCKSNLHQLGIALHMYADDNRTYPYAYLVFNDPSDFQFWFASLGPYHSLSWTNPNIHCPAYQGKINIVVESDSLGRHWSPVGSYAYNSDGTGDQALGLGPFWSPSPQVPLPLRPIPPSQVVVPSDMFAILDARRITDTDGVAGWPFMPGHFLKYDRETQRLRHGKGFNFLFCDGHVMTIRRT